MQLPFFRSKKPANPRSQPPRRAAGAGVEDGSVQAARTRARRRLIGALVLLAAGVVGFPLLFETQPRPLSVDTPIFVPGATSARVAPTPAARPLPVVPADAGNEPVASAAAATAAPALPMPVTTPRPPPVAAQLAPSVVAGVASAAARVAAPVPAVAPAVAPKPVAKPEPQTAKPEAVTPVTPVKPVKPEPETAALASGRFVVQVGAYNDPERLRTARQKVESLGFKTYIQDVDSPTGKRTRVRVGPFDSRQEADAVATKVKASGMQANILAL